MIKDSVERNGKTKMKVQNEIISKWFKPNAINNLSFSRLPNKEDLFIVGYQFTSEMNEEDMNEYETKNTEIIESKNESKEEQNEKELQSIKTTKEKNVVDDAGDFL